MIRGSLRTLRSSAVSASHNLHRSASTATVLDFHNAETSFKNKSVSELVRSKAVLTLCQVRPFVTNAKVLLEFSYTVFGKIFTNAILKSSFFGHFCAGEDETSIAPTIKALERNGIGSILDYAAESDVPQTKTAAPQVVPRQQHQVSNASVTPSSSDEHASTVGRVYDYESEALCDAHRETFEQCIRSVHNVSPAGFAAIKCTALGNPELLRRASATITEIHRLFKSLDTEGTGYVTKDQFLATFSKQVQEKSASSLFEQWDVDKDGRVDYIEWTNGLPIEDAHEIVQFCTEVGPLYKSVLNEEERRLLKAMKARIFSLIDLAQSLNVRVMIDAEHRYFQPAIDSITAGLAKKWNIQGNIPVVFGTYQMYLRDSRERLQTDLERAQKGGYTFAAKLVRGAYLEFERAHAKKSGVEDPTNPSLEATHASYNEGLRDVLSRMAAGDAVEVMVATHNQESIERAVQAMAELGLSPDSKVYFGQLLGMSDHLTFNLGRNGYKAYKYVPYGKVEEVMPYLLRRAQENADALSGARAELKLVNRELVRRMYKSIGIQA